MCSPARLARPPACHATPRRPSFLRPTRRFHVYVCAQLLLKFSARLKKMAFEELTTFLKALPTRDWAVSDVEELLSQAFVWRTAFAGSPASLR